MVTISSLQEFLYASKVSRDFRGVKFFGINFNREDGVGTLFDYDFKDTYFSHCTFNGICFSNCDFASAYIDLCNFSNVEMSHCRLHSVYLTHSKLIKVKMSMTDFSLASASGTIFDKIRTNEYVPFFHIMCPEEGSFIAYKKAHIRTYGIAPSKSVLVKLEIPKNAKRSSANSYKCRANMAKVLGFIGLDYNVDENKYDIVGDITLRKDQYVESSYDPNFTYPLGHTVKVDNFDEDRWSECSTGIHFFMNKEMARDYD